MHMPAPLQNYAPDFRSPWTMAGLAPLPKLAIWSLRHLRHGAERGPMVRLALVRSAGTQRAGAAMDALSALEDLQRGARRWLTPILAACHPWLRLDEHCLAGILAASDGECRRLAEARAVWFAHWLGGRADGATIAAAAGDFTRAMR